VEEVELLLEVHLMVVLLLELVLALLAVERSLLLHHTVN
tara:strand:+ start:311 stop:427 length:117 start_codon:yes stop_codon:yes gene_type:complete